MMNFSLNQPNTVDDVELNTDDSVIRNIGFGIIFVVFGVFGTWAFLAPIDGSALAVGVVKVKSYKKTVQHLDGGIVAELLVKEGDIVNKNDVLLILDDTEAKASLEIIRSQYITLLAQNGRLKAERDELKKVFYAAELADETDQRISEAKKMESHLFLIRKKNYEGEISILKLRISQIKSKIRGLKSQIKYKKELKGSYSKEINDLEELLAEGFANKQHLRDAQRKYFAIKGELAGLRSEIATSEIQQGETRLQILQIKKKVQKEVAEQLSEVKAQLNDVKERLTATEDRLIRIEIKAPGSGRVLGLVVHTIGGVIAPGSPILDIVPQDAALIIDAQVNPMDIDRVYVGLIAEVRFSAFKQEKTPVMHGQVIHLSADIVTDEKAESSYYQARIELTKESQNKLGALQLLPGMPAEVLINTGERTLFQYLLQPVNNAFARAFIED
jgi:epimerase transport system membrane fusion protein